MKIYHITKKTNAENIKENGFNLDLAGTAGGLQMGTGVYFSGSMTDVVYWEHRLYIQDSVVLECEIDDEKIFAAKDIMKAEMLKAADARGWWFDGGITEKAKTDLGIEIENFDAQVKTAAAQDAGYAGIIFGDGENIVVWDIKAIIIK